MDALTQYFPDLETWRGPLVSVLHVVLILVLAWLALRLSRRGLARLRMRLQQDLDDSERIKRLNTLEQVFRYVLAVLIILVAGMLVLSELGISIAPVLAAAGVVGIAVGFGAQSLVKDYFTGLFLLLENQVRQGDVVEVGGKGGLVEEMTLRYIRLRDYEGSVHYVPNGIIDTVTNRSRGFAFALIDVSVAYREDVDAVCAVMREVAADLRADPELSSKIVEDIEIAGVEQWADSAVVIRCRFKTLPLEQWNVRRAYLQRLKKAFDAADIEIPFPHLTLYQGQNKDGSAPPLRLERARGGRTAENPHAGAARLTSVNPGTGR
ncbi:mechanosensitive ion channel [Thiobacillus denitrificans ATCC 25259]|uniref:Mechanosensitive ion channel n=1 Tax=Thiobacillus denitrificans (strain ATCC 25259 / T1) TaxID=292415 RepID=Q3SLF9_THIDA|nr:mechanosensitive ion channel family protein [Thiobacillus denitrificans]AAZ96452.1 mechanosensitive ion channel [Thiobacillus denitrificans ATCC 25259]